MLSQQAGTGAFGGQGTRPSRHSREREAVLPSCACFHDGASFRWALWGIAGDGGSSEGALAANPAFAPEPRQHSPTSLFIFPVIASVWKSCPRASQVAPSPCRGDAALLQGCFRWRRQRGWSPNSTPRVPSPSLALLPPPYHPTAVNTPHFCGHSLLPNF